MEFSAQNNNVAKGIEITAEEAISEVLAGVSFVLSRPQKSFSLEDGVFMALLEAGAMLQRAARIVAETGNLRNPDVKQKVDEAMDLANSAQTFVSRAVRMGLN